MDLQEIAQEMLNYLNEVGQYQSFINWAEERGFDIEELEQDIEDKVENF